MSLLKDWRDSAYSLDINSKEGKLFWNNYFVIEQGIYEKLLSDPDFIEWLKSKGESLVHSSRYDDWCRFIDNNTKCDCRYYSKCDFVYAILYMQRLCDKESIFDIALDFRNDSNGHQSGHAAYSRIQLRRKTV